MKYLLILVFILFSTMLNGYSQSGNREELQKQEEILRIELRDLNNLLNDTKKNKKISLKQIQIIKQKIATRQKLRDKIINQIKLIDAYINQNESQIIVLENQLDILKKEYAKNIIKTYKNRSQNQYLQFIFFTNNFNESFKRIRYFKSYNFYKTNLKLSIVSTENILHIKTDALNADKKQQELAIQKSNQELNNLQKDKQEHDKLLSALKTKETSIEKQLKAKELQRKKMQQLIFNLIKKETEEAILKEKLKKENANLAKGKTGLPNTKIANTKQGVKNIKESRPYSALENSENDIETSINFEKNKGKLPWPVDKGSVDVQFGISTIPNTKLTRKSDGIEISVPIGSLIKSVADGKVTSIGEMNGEQFVMIFHGKYISVYRNLESVKVSLNQELKAHSIIGKSGIGIEGEGTLIFMITNDQGTPLNPEIWLKPKN